MNQNSYLFDKFGAKIFCRHCKSRGFEDKHHPNDCKMCGFCGKIDQHLPSCKLKIEALKKGQNKRNNEVHKAMRRSVLIDNSKSLSPSEPVGLDVEKIQGLNGQMLPGWVSVYQNPKQKRHQPRTDDIVYSAKIRQLPSDVKNYATPWSGLSRIDLSERAVPWDQVKKRLREILSGRTVVGVALNKDLIDLGLEDIEAEKIDLQQIFYDDNNQPISLKILAYALLNKKIQEFAENFNNNKAHDPVIDSRITLKIYKNLAKFQPINGSYQWCRDTVEQALMTGIIKNHAH